MFGNNRKSSIQTSVYSEYEQTSGLAGKQILNDWLQKVSTRKNQPSPRFNLHQPNELPHFGKHKKSSVENFTLGQIDDINQQSPGQRLDTFPINDINQRSSVERLSLFDNKQNNSMGSNVHHMRESSTQSKSFINAMRALQEKCKRLELEKTKMDQQAAVKFEQLRSQNDAIRKSHNQLQVELEHKAVEAIEMKSRISILQKSNVDGDRLTQQNGRLKEDKSRLERRIVQAEKCNIELSEKYAQVTKQYQAQCRMTSECEVRVSQLEQLFNQLKVENQQMREINNRLERNSHNTELVSRYNSLVTRNQQLTSIIEKSQKQWIKEKESMRSEIRRLEQQNTSEDSQKNRQISQLERQKDAIQNQCKQHELVELQLRDKLEKKNQEMLELMKNMLNKTNEKAGIEEYKTASSRNRRSKVLTHPKVSQEQNTEAPQADQPQQDWGYRSAIQEKVTSRFVEQPNPDPTVDRVRVVSYPSNKSSKQRSLDKPKKSKHSETKSIMSSKADEGLSKPHHSPRNNENLITFENPFKRGSNKKSSRRVVYASSQPRGMGPEMLQPIEVNDFDREEHHHSQFCEVHHPNSIHVCMDHIDTPDFHSKDLNKLLLIEAEKQAIMLFEEHEHLLNASKVQFASMQECQSSSARAEYLGRLKQLNEQIRINSEKICEYKTSFNRKPS